MAGATSSPMVVSATGCTSVNVWEIKVADYFDKVFKALQMPAKTGTGETKIIDIGKIQRIVTITGFLHDESAAGNQTKKENVIAILRKRTCTLTWGTATYETITGNMKKANFDEAPGIVSDGTEESAGNANDKNIQVVIAVIEGTSIYGS